MKIVRAFATFALFGAGLCLAVPSAANGTPADAAMQENVTLIIRFEASEAGIAQLKAILDGVAEAMQSEAGFVSAKVYRNIDNPKVFILEEVWQSKELHLAHYDRINRSGDWAKIKAMLVAEPQMGYYTANRADRK